MSTSVNATTQPRFTRTLVVLCALAIGASVLALLVGQGSLAEPSLRGVFLQLRAGRVAAAFLAGSALAVAGVLVQGLFRNPLASPSVIGTTGGASLGGRLALVGFHVFSASSGSAWFVPEMLLPLGCVAGALAALAILVSVARIRDDLVVVLLTGFLLSSLFVSLGGLVMSLAQERWELARAIISFALGDLSGASPRHVALSLPLVVLGCLAAFVWAKPLDLMLTGEDEARSLGVDVKRLRRWCIAWTAILTAAAVSIGGNVGFVGLVVPHALRPFVGVMHRKLVVASAIAGGTFLVLCDTACRAIPGSGEIPLGVVTGLIGAPVFLWLLIRSRRVGQT